MKVTITKIKKADTKYGGIIITSYDTQDKYLKAIEDLRSKGFNVYE